MGRVMGRGGMLYLKLRTPMDLGTISTISRREGKMILAILTMGFKKLAMKPTFLLKTLPPNLYHLHLNQPL
jgi:hypothetical protein